MEEKTIIEDGIWVSVIVPCYNAAQYLDQCMEHLTEQTIGIAHMEIILVDDASTDDGATMNKLLEWERKYPDSIVVIPLEENVRQGGARNIGIYYARGTYILFCDADDWLDKRAVEHLYLAAHQYQCDVVEFEHQKVWDRTGPTEAPLCGSRPNTYTEISSVEDRKKWIMNKSFKGCWNKLYKTALIKEHEIRFAEGVTWEEPLFTYLVRVYETRHYYMNEILYFYYQHEGSTMHGTYRKYDNMYTHALLYEEAVSRGLMENYREEFAYIYWFWYFQSSLLFAVQAGQFYSRQEFMEMQESVREKVPDLKNNKYFQAEYGDIPALADLIYCDGSAVDMAELEAVYKNMFENLYKKG
jgi:glycosyltransferase involved in cell wall biosynthesis